MFTLSYSVGSFPQLLWFLTYLQISELQPLLNRVHVKADPTFGKSRIKPFHPKLETGMSGLDQFYFLVELFT